MVGIGMLVPRRLSLGLVLAGSFACGDHLLGHDEEFEEFEEFEELDAPAQPVCMVLSGTRGYWDNGESHIVWNPERDIAGGVCMCMTEAQFLAHELHDDLNDAMLVECERLSALIGFDWDECAEDHANGDWLGATYRASPGDFGDFLVTDDLDCE